jgi:hypothetical protein
MGWMRVETLSRRVLQLLGTSELEYGDRSFDDLIAILLYIECQIDENTFIDLIAILIAIL